MAFTAGTASVVNGTSTIVVTGSGNLDDLATAVGAANGMTRNNNVIVYDPTNATAKIIAVAGTLLENRTGTRTVLIRGGGHIVWGYKGSATTGGTTTFGAKSSNGVYTGRVDVVYESTAFALGGANLFSSAENKCVIGAGTFNGVAGSVSYNVSGAHLDIFDSVVAASFDNFSFFMTSAGDPYTHMWKASGITTTTNTVFTFVQRPMEGPAGVTNVTSFYTDVGFRWLSPRNGNVISIQQPKYDQVDFNDATAGALAKIYDPIVNYIKSATINNFNTHPGIKEIWRTMNVTATDSLGATISNPTPKLVTLLPDNTTNITNFSGKTASYAVLQSRRASGVNHDATGLGYTDQGTYDFYIVGFGYAAQNKTVNVKTAHSGNSGILWTTNIVKSPIVTTAYTSVVTAPFSFSTTGTGTLTVSANATVKEAAEYLFKLAYDSPADSFWRGLNHTPVTLDSDGSYNFGAINITVSGGTLSGARFKTNSTVTTSGLANISATYSDSNANSQVTIVGVTLDANTRLYVSTNSGTSYIELTSTTYKYNSGSSSVIFKLTKGTLTQTDSYTLASGLTNQFTSFTNDVGVLLQATEQNIKAVIPSVSTIKTEIESTTVLAKKADIKTEVETSEILAKKTDTDAIKTETASIKKKTDNIPDSPAAVGSEMVLTSAYNSAKTASSATELAKLTGLLTSDNTKFTTTALSNAPSSGSSGGLTTDQAKQLQELYRSGVAITYTTSTAIPSGATELPIASTYSDGYFTNHYVVINDGAGNVTQRFISEHINRTIPPRTALMLNQPIGAVPSGSTIMILIRTTDQDGADIKTIFSA